MGTHGHVVGPQEDALIEAFLRGVETVFVEHFEDAVTVGVGDVATESPDDLVGEIALSGSIVGRVRLRFPRETAAQIAEVYAGMPMPDDTLADAMGEIVNLVTGSAKSSIETSRIDMTPPTVVEGRELTTDADDTLDRSLECDTAYGIFWLEYRCSAAASARRKAA